MASTDGTYGTHTTYMTLTHKSHKSYKSHRWLHIMYGITPAQILADLLARRRTPS